MDAIGVLSLLIPLAGIGTSVLFMVGAYKLIVRWMDRKQAGGDALAETARLRAEVDALQDVAFRVQELEERLDFAERLLAKQRHDELAPGG